MNLCPACKTVPARPGFCDACFRSLEPEESGRFARLLLAERIAPSASARQAWPGPDLLAVTYERPGLGYRLLRPGLKYAAVAGLVIGLMALGSMGFSAMRRGQARGLAVQGLSRTAELQQKHQLAEAAKAAGEALVQAELSGDKPLQVKAHRSVAGLADSLEEWGKASSHYQSALHLEHPVNLVEAQKQLDLDRCRKAEQLLELGRQKIAAHDSVAALKYTSGAGLLLETHHGSPKRVAECCYLTARIFQGLGQKEQCRKFLRQALAAQPGHAQAGKLLARVNAAPPRPKPDPFVAVRAAVVAPPPVQAAEVVVQPSLGESSYPQYQPPQRMGRSRSVVSSPSQSQPQLEAVPVSVRPQPAAYTPPRRTSTYKAPKSRSRSSGFSSPTFQSPTFKSPTFQSP